MAKFQETEKAVNSLNDLLEKLNKTISETSSQLIKLNDSTKKQATSSNDLNNKNKQLDATQKELLKLDKQLESASAKLTDEYKKKNAALLKAKEAVRQQNEEQKKSLGIQNRFVGGIKAGITQFALLAGAIGGGVTALVKFGKKVIESSQVMSDKWTVATEQAKAATNLFFKSIATGNFDNFFGRLKEVTDQARLYAESIDRLTDLNRSLDIQEAESRDRLVELKIASQDVTKSYKERQAAIEEIKIIEGDLAAKRKEYAAQENKDLLTNISVQTGISKEKIETYIKEYQSIDDLLSKGQEYKNALIELEQQQLAGSDVATRALAQIFNKEGINEAKKALSEYGDEFKVGFGLLQMYGSLNDAEMEALKQSYIKVANAQSQFNENTRKVQNLENSLTEQQRKDFEAKEKAKQKAFEDRIKAEGEALRQQDEFSKSLKFDEVAFIEEMDAQIATINMTLNESIKQGQSDLTEWSKEQIDKRIEEEKKLLEFKKEAEQELVDIGIESINQLFDLRASYRDSEIEALEQQKNFEVELAKEKGQSTAAIEDKFAKKEKDLRKKQAIQEKLQTLFNTAINIAEGVVKYASNPITAPLVPAFIALGAVQTGIILATPLPKFFKGTEDAPGGLSIVGDSFSGGSQTEYVQLPSGEGFIARNPMVVDLPRGSKVFTEHSPETKAALNQFNDKNIVSEIRALRRGISKLSKTDRGYEIYNSETNTTQILRARRFGR